MQIYDLGSSFQKTSMLIKQHPLVFSSKGVVLLLCCCCVQMAGGALFRNSSNPTAINNVSIFLCCKISHIHYIHIQIHVFKYQYTMEMMNNMVSGCF